MREPQGDFQLHITGYSSQADALASFAAGHGLTFLHILLDRGHSVSQPMITVNGRGSPTDQRALLQHWQAQLRAARLYSCRSKIEVSASAAGLPQSEDEAVAEPAGRYFEHHVKLLLPGAALADLIAVNELIAGHGARLSRNARRIRPDGMQERFVTQRCHGVGQPTARDRLDALVEVLRSAGYQIVDVKQEYVVFDDAPGHDLGWLQSPTRDTGATTREDRMRTAPAGSPDYPLTYQPLAGAEDLRQRAAFDPALKQYPNAYRAGEPQFTVPDTAAGWKTARRTAMNHALGIIASTVWAEHLVLRGSITLSAWIGDAAREPGDLDFVVTPHTITSNSPQAAALVQDIKAALRAEPAAGLQSDRITETAIWTYERADGRRLAIPFQAPGLPEGHLQIDIVFGEQLPLPPETLVLPGVDVPMLAAPASLSLAWKLLWLATDRYPQGKDLYDAALLAEHTTVDRALVHDLLRAELGDEADAFAPESVLAWAVDWTNFTDEYRTITGTLDHWATRLAVALDQAWASPSAANT